MERRIDNTRASRDFGFLLSYHDWVYLLGLLVPFVVYDVGLKGLLVFSGPEAPEIADGLGFMRSDLLFCLGYALLWVALFAATRKRLLRWVVVGLFHATTVLVALVTLGAYRYFVVTGSTLDSDYLLLWLYSPEGTGGAIVSETTPGLIILISGVVFYILFGPLVITRLVQWWRDVPNAEGGTGVARTSWLRLVGVGLVAYAMFSLSLMPGGGQAGASESLSRDPFIDIVTTAAETAGSEGLPDIAADTVEDPPPDASLQTTAELEKRNVVLVFLESTRAGATTPYNQNLGTTPFLDNLAQQSLLAEQARPVVSHSTNAYTATSCGIEPPMDPWGTRLLGARDDVVPYECLPDLLKEQGYNTAFFTSSTSDFENLPKIVENLGYEEFYPVEGMETEGFEKANYFGYEDDVMLKPSEEWLKQQKGSDEPFMAAYATITAHHEYLAPQQRYGRKEFDGNNDLVNRYLNGVRYQDIFLKNLFDQYKKMGLYEDTVFVIVGDHGQAFGEHGRFQHDNVPYEESTRIPLLVHDPKRFQDGARATAPVNQLDVLPTVTDLLGYEVEGGGYGGYSLLRPMPSERTLMTSCWNEEGCLARIKGNEKYIYNFGDRPDEVYDLSKDPGERQNLADQRSPEELEERRRELVEWRANVNSMYGIRAPE